MIKSTDFAYSAGYIDGDGCFHLRNQRLKTRSKFMYSLIIVSVVKETMEWFKKEFGGQIYIKNVPDNHKPTYHFCLRGKKCIEFVQLILPYLVEKQDEAYLLFDFCNSKSNSDRIELISKITQQKNKLNLVDKSHKQEFESIRSTIIPTQEDFAYLAGFIDSECCLGICRYKSKNRDNFLYKILLQCNNTKSPVFKWLLQRFGGQVHFIDRSKYVNRRNQLTWRICSSSLADILPNILPFIKQKKSVCEQLMKFYETTVPLAGNISRHNPKFNEFYKPILEERERIFHIVKSLNHKGI